MMDFWRKVIVACLLAVIFASGGVIVAKSRYNGFIRHDLWLSSDNEAVVRKPLQWRDVRKTAARIAERAKPRKTAAERQPTMSIWLVSNPGDATYAGQYSDSGSTWLGQPIYVNSSSRYLFFLSDNLWYMYDQPPTVAGGVDGEDCIYRSETATLPGGTWAAQFNAPAPTVTEYVAPADPVTNWPYTYSAAWSAPSPTGGPCIAPCRATIGGTAYIVLAEQGGMFHLYDPVGDAWAEADYGAALFATDQYDPTQGAGLFDAGDGTHVWANSGSYFIAGSGFAMRWNKFALTPGTGAALVSSANVAVPTLWVSNAVQVATGQVRFVRVNAGNVLFYEYTIGAGSPTLINEWTPIISAYSDVETQQAGLNNRYDGQLYRASDGTLYWMRHTVSGSQHYIEPYQVDDSSLTALTPFQIASTDYYQTWGYYSDVSRYVGDIGSGGTASAQVDPAGAFWTPAAGGATRAPFPLGRVTRRWYLDGTPLLVVGWAADDSDDLKPFVMNIEPYALQATAASSFAAGRQAAGARTTSYAVDEGLLSHVSAEAVTSFAAGRRATAAAASSHAAGLAVTGEAETSFAADLARPSTTPHPVQVNVSMVRGRVIG